MDYCKQTKINVNESITDNYVESMQYLINLKRNLKTSYVPSELILPKKNKQLTKSAKLTVLSDFGH